MNKVIATIFSIILFAVFFAQVQQVLAKEGSDDAPITSPITSPNCKPGWGFGDKNHCHYGPPGQVNNTHSNSENHEHGKD